MTHSTHNKNQYGDHTAQASANELNIHIAEKGQGPLVLLLHGFPELWYLWRHQILYLAVHGYQAVAPDFMGMARQQLHRLMTTPSSVFSICWGDVIGLLDAIINS